jgi:hypothetical protein
VLLAQPSFFNSIILLSIHLVLGYFFAAQRVDQLSVSFCLYTWSTPKGEAESILPDVLITNAGSDLPSAFASWEVIEH